MKFDYLNLPVLPKEERKLVGFIVNDVSYGLHIMCVKEVINPSPLTDVPAMPPYVVGVLDHREGVVPVIDLRTRFGLKRRERDRRTKWIITETQGMNVGLEVDRVTDVMNLDPSKKREKLQISEESEPWIKDVFQRAPGNLIFELNLDNFIDINHLRRERLGERETDQ
jgi:purine-binding chemotaxis protein CheW